MSSRLEQVRDYALEEIKYASSTVSQNARAIGIALAVVVYSLILAGDKEQFIQQHFWLLITATVFGVLCVLLDYVQYYAMIWENRSILGTIRAEQEAIRALKSIDENRARQRAVILLDSVGDMTGRSIWSRVREICFHAKFLAAIGGSVVIVVLIWEVVSAPPPPPPPP